MTEGKDIECAAVQMLTTGDTEMQELKELHYNSSIALRSSAKRAEMRVCLKGAKHFRCPPLAEGGLLSRDRKGLSAIVRAPRRLAYTDADARAHPHAHFLFVSGLFFCHSASPAPRKLGYLYVYLKLSCYKENSPKHSVLLSWKGAKAQ